MDIKLTGLPDRMSRRGFLAGLNALGLSALTTPSVFGASHSVVGIEDDTPCVAAGAADDRNILLDPGCGIRVGPYGNPLLAPAAFHRIPLHTLSDSSVDLASARLALGMGAVADKDVKQHVQGCGLYQLAILFPGEDHYKIIDLAGDPHSLPDICVASDGLLTVSHRGRRIIEEKDGIYLQGLYRPDLNRFDPNGFIGICGPQRAGRKIAVLELATPLLAVREDALNQPQDLLQPLGGMIDAKAGRPIKGERIIIKGDNAWRYRVDPDSGLAVECKSIASLGGGERGKAYVQANWDSLGPRLRYTVESKSGEQIILRPEVDLGRTLRLGDFGDYIAGIVHYSLNGAGELVVARTTISGLASDAKLNVSTIRVEGGALIVGSKRESVIDARCKPHLVDKHGIDLYTASPEVREWMCREGAFERSASRPISPFRIDIMAAYDRWQVRNLPHVA